MPSPFFFIHIAVEPTIATYSRCSYTFNKLKETNMRVEDMSIEAICFELLNRPDSYAEKYKNLHPGHVT